MASTPSQASTLLPQAEAIATMRLVLLFVGKVLHALEIGDMTRNCFGAFLLKSLFLFSFFEDPVEERIDGLYALPLTT